MDDVRVTYNATLPGTIGARAVAKGSRIAIAPGAESSVPHELWHVVQQKLGLVQADSRRAGHAISADPMLERDADAFGEQVSGRAIASEPENTESPRSAGACALAPMQLQDSDEESEDADDEPDDEKPAKKRRGGTTKKPVAVTTRKVRDTKSKSPKPALPRKRKAASSSTTKVAPAASPVVPSWETGLLDFPGVQQQGQISIAQGKHYEGLVSQKSKRAEQIVRHFTNLALNRTTSDQAAKDKPLFLPDGRPKLNKKGKQQIRKAKRPVEVQASAVGGRILINTNNRKSTKSLLKGIGAGSLLDYALDVRAQKPALDQDKARPKRYQEKLRKAIAKSRPWQQPGAAGEAAADLGQADSILTAIQKRGVGVFDLRDENQITEQLARWDDKSAPSTYVVLHSNRTSTEHAERIQTAFRHRLLGKYETEQSTAPTGPKTTCLGCTAFHKANYPKLVHQSPFTGAYFGAGSPVTTPEEIDEAKKLIASRPATGSNSQEGYERNSDEPDSDTDDEGNPSYPRPRSYDVAFGAPRPTARIWDVDARNSITVPASWKKPAVLKQHRAHPGVSVSGPASRASGGGSRKRKAGSPAEAPAASKARKGDGGKKVVETKKRARDTVNTSAPVSKKAPPAKKRKKEVKTRKKGK